MQNYVVSSPFLTMARMPGAGVLFPIVILARHRDKATEILSLSSALSLPVGGLLHEGFT